MNILIAVASRHGSTRAIAEVIAHELRESGHAVELRNMGEVSDVQRCDAAIIGSAIYMGKWLPEARRFVEKNGEKLSGMPVWLFSSGPLGRDDPLPRADPADLQALVRATQARGHTIFVGALDKSKLGVGERLVTKMVKAPEGDFRDWEAIRGWAREIASALPAPAAPGS
jgi:menaquinone-dependent protoporphyrinogen oxidase